MDYPGNLFVIAAPSGAGKSSLVRRPMKSDRMLQLSVSHTTRARRGQEQDGKDYFFVTDQTFDAMVQNDAFLEWAHVHGQRYGTSKMAIEERIVQGGDVILEIDFQGAQQIKQIFVNAVTIFILPPSYEELRRRLQNRGEDADDVIELRMKNAASEIAQAERFDFVIINDAFDDALEDLKSVIHAQRLRFSVLRRTKATTFKALNIT